MVLFKDRTAPRCFAPGCFAPRCATKMFRTTLCCTRCTKKCTNMHQPPTRAPRCAPPRCAAQGCAAPGSYSTKILWALRLRVVFIFRWKKTSFLENLTGLLAGIYLTCFTRYLQAQPTDVSSATPARRLTIFLVAVGGASRLAL